MLPRLDVATLEQFALTYFRDRAKPLVELAAPYSLDDLAEAFKGLRESMKRMLNGLTPEQVAYSPDPSTYSLSEVVSHLIAAQGNTYNGLIDLGESTRPHVDPVPRDPGGGAEKDLTAGELQARLTEATEQLLTVLYETALAAEQRVEDNAYFGKISNKGLFLFQLMHDLDHFKQAQVMRRTPGFPRKPGSDTLDGVSK